MDKKQTDIENVIKEYSKTVYRLAFAKTGNKFDADEIFQEVFLRYIKKQVTFHDKEHEKAWLIRVTINVSKKFLTSSWNKKTIPLEEVEEYVSDNYTELYYELSALPPNYREVIHLFYYEDMSIAQIANVLKRRESTIRTQLTRARQLLRKLMKEEDYV